jgi:hypothetical protein
MRRQTCLVFPAAVLAAVAIYAQAPSSQESDTTVYQFGQVRPDAAIRHTFSFRNSGAVPLEIQQVQLTPPLIVTKMTSRIEPGSEGRVSVEMQTPLKEGEFEGGIVVHFKDDMRKPETFYVEGEIVPAIEFIPHKVVLLSAQRGHPKAAVVEIVNHEAEPMDILHAECNAARFDCELATLEQGRRYRLTVTLKGEGPGAQQIDTLVLPTSSHGHPFLEIKAFSKIRDRVYAFPDTVDFDTISADYLKTRPQMAGFLTHEVTIFQAEGTDFQVSAETDVPFLKITTRTSAQFKDRVGLAVAVDPTKLKSGTVKGSIIVSTNDPDFPKLVIPVSGVVEGNW